MATAKPMRVADGPVQRVRDSEWRGQKVLRVENQTVTCNIDKVS